VNKYGGGDFVELLKEMFGRKVKPLKAIPFCVTEFTASLFIILRRR